ncbi:PilZ domain-containing protein [Vibrio antiquarius]|uniref:PilZ domain-containing protein n=1 Tax=Vibrio diabolicus subgroup TaxID=2315253 RepID=UPI0022A8768B|nr:MULTISPECIES: PilZ domain-containing protein [Vibrio diabolicus subgroup]MCR9938725.1 PilZ domain-containing protein [Vibrio antiquarius]MCS0028582.1 PilZ domain-containing protein [Vibrio alginolyticus]MCZ0923757.1 PilZ domain-containing protein [Vibrio diabolicus]
MAERRRFSRILHQAPTKVEQRDLAIEARIQDLSLHGLLMKVEETEALDPALPAHVTFSFDQSEQVITLKAQIVDISKCEIRLKIIKIDIESISQLKRFIELNVGNNDLLNRELEHLSDLGEK